MAVCEALLAEDGPAPADGENCEQHFGRFWSGAVYDGDVAGLLGAKFPGGERLHGGEVDPRGMAWDPNNVQRWKHKVGFHNRGVQCDTPMARWAGERKDWIELMTKTRPQRRMSFGSCSSQ